MISRKDEYSIRSGYPAPKTPLERLIEKETPQQAIMLDAEVLIFLADFSAQYPEKWRTVKERINDPRSTLEEIAMRLHISRRTVRRHLADLRKAGREWLESPEKKRESARDIFVRYEAEGTL
ncbi:MAG: helix-turn-helix domain-containing protein [Victivallaceae bacterium]|nr:helix-turn-helix domain-containing protein [Victivallaceae bacterium]